MSYQTSKWQSLGDGTDSGVFSLWYIDNTPSLYLPSWASPYLRNARLDWNTVSIRPGHSLFKTLNSVAHWIGAYYRTLRSNDRIAVRENNDTDKKIVLYDEDGTATPINTSTYITTDDRMNFTNVADKLFCMNGTDVIWKIDSWSYSVLTNIPTNFAPRFSVVFNGCQRASGWSTNPNKVYKSKWWLFDDDGNALVWDFDDFVNTWSDVVEFQEPITGLCANSQALFYFSRNKVAVTGQQDIETISITNGWSRVAYTNSVLTAKEWAINHESIVGVGNDVYYVTPTNKICKCYRWNNVYGYEVQEISSRKYVWIDWIMKTLAKDQSDCWWYYLAEENLIKWFFKSEGSVLHDVIIVYDIEKDKFLIDDSEFYGGWINFNGKNYTISEVESKMYLDEYWLDDEDAPIPFEYRTKDFYVSDPSFKKIFWESRLTCDINTLANLKQEIWVDWSKVDEKVIDSEYLAKIFGWIGSYSVGTAVFGTEIEADSFEDEVEEYKEINVIRTKGNLNVRGRSIQFRYSNMAVWGKVRLKYLSLKCEVLPELTNNI